MAYAPGVADQSGQILAQSIGQIAQQYAQSQDKLRLTDAEVAHLKSTVDFAAQKNILTPEELQQFTQGNLSKKREIASLAGMKYKDWQDAQDRATISPEMAAELKASGYLAAPMGGGRFQYLQTPGETPQQTPEVTRMLQEAGVIPVNTGRGRVDFITPPQRQEPFQFDPTRDVVPLPGGGSFVRTSPSGGGNIMPGNAKAWQPSPEDLRLAQSGGFTYMNTAEGPVLRAMRGSAGEKPAPFRDAADAIYAANGRGPTPQEIRQQQQYILEAAKKDPLFWGKKNVIDETMAQELARLSQELKAKTNPPAGLPMPVRAATPKATPKAATVHPSAGDRSKFAGPVLPALPESDGLPTAEDPTPEPAGEVLPPLPNVDEPVDVTTPEEAAALPPGTKFRTPDGRVILKK